MSSNPYFLISGCENGFQSPSVLIYSNKG